MENLIIKENPDMPFYPAVHFDAETGVCEISGESYMEETYRFYDPIIKWIKQYTDEEKKPLTFNFKLTYFNTSSSKLILDLIDVMKNYEKQGGNVKVNWFYDPEDPDMQDEVEDFIIESGMKINLINF
jgi:hypothetical protein